MENSERDGNTRPPYLPPEKPVCGQEATDRTGHGTADWLKIGKGVCQGLLGANTQDPTPKKAIREKT